MATFLLSLVIVVLSLAGLGLGVLAGRGRLRGGCGGEASECACREQDRKAGAE